MKHTSLGIASWSFRCHVTEHMALQLCTLIDCTFNYCVSNDVWQLFSITGTLVLSKRRLYAAIAAYVRTIICYFIRIPYEGPSRGVHGPPGPTPWIRHWENVQCLEAIISTAYSVMKLPRCSPASVPLFMC